MTPTIDLMIVKNISNQETVETNINNCTLSDAASMLAALAQVVVAKAYKDANIEIANRVASGVIEAMVIEVAKLEKIDQVDEDSTEDTKEE